MKRKVSSHRHHELHQGSKSGEPQDSRLLITALQSLTHPFLVIDAENYAVLLDNSRPDLEPSEGGPKCYALSHNSTKPCSENGECCPLEIIKETRKPTVVKHVHYDAEGKPHHFEVHGYPVFDDDSRVTSIIEFSMDVTEREVAQDRQRFATQVLDTLNQPSEKTDIIRDILLLIKQFTSFEAVGIRLKEDDDFPYYETIGFPAAFVEKENYLCSKNRLGDAKCDSDGEPLLECMCGNVIRGRTEPKQPFFTDGGSFWSNGTTNLLATTTETERQSSTRNVCNAEGYESVALIPLKSGAEVVGLLQLNDTRTDMFTLDMIEFFEGLGASVGIALSRRRAEQALKAAHDGLEVRVRERTAELEAANDRLLDEVVARKRTAAALERTSRALKVLSEGNRSLVRARTELELLKSVCEVIVASGNYRLAWVGYAEHDTQRSVRPVCQAGFEDGYLETLNISWDDVERGRGPTGTAIRTGHPTIIKDMMTDPRFTPWRSEAAKRGYASSIALPLRTNETTIGALNIYATEPDAFDKAEVELLVELTDDLVFGIMTLRTEAERKFAERALGESKERYRELVEGTDNVVAQIDAQGKIMFVNRAAEQIFGVSPGECVGASCFDFIFPKDVQRTREAIGQWVKSRTRNTTFENRAISRTGKVSEMLWTIDSHYDQGGRLTFLNWIGRDFTERKKAEEALRYRLRFEELVASLSTSFINLKAEEIEEGIDHALKKIGEFAGVDRSYIFEFSDDGTRMSNTHEWCAENTEPQKETLQDMDTRVFPWAITQLRRFDTVHVPRVADLPPEAMPERQTFEQQSIKSLILVPMIYSGSLLGFVGFDAVAKEQSWGEDILALLKITGDMFVSAIARSRAERELRKVNEELRADRKALQNKNIAMREVLDSFEKEKQATREQITANVEEALLPMIARLKDQSDEKQRLQVELLEQYLKNIASPFIDTLKSKFARLTPRELDICHMIKAGRPSKEIAQVLNVSLLTVHKHREQIREKLGLKNTATNLNNYLQSL